MNANDKKNANKKNPACGRALRAAALAAAVLAAAPAGAHEAGDWLVKAGVSDVIPKSGNGSAAGLDLDVGDSFRPSITATYMATQNIGIELLAAVPFRHGISASSGGAGVGEIGSTKELPPTLSLLWYFLPDSQVQPYVGLGVNFTRFFSTEGRGPLAGASLNLDNSWGVAAQVGVDVKLSDHWLINASLRYIDINSSVRVNGSKVGTAHIDPWVPTIAVGYRF